MPTNKNGRTKRSKRSKSTKPKPTTPKPVLGRGRSGAGRGAAQTQLVKHGLNAFSEVHIPLPVSTGRYHTVRTVRTIAVTDFLTLLAPVRTEHGDWRTSIAYGFPLSTTLLNSASIRQTTSENPFPSGGNDVECVPSAFSVQVTCNTSLLNAAGVTYIGRMKTGYTAPSAADARSASELGSALLSYAKLRMVSNSELVSRPKQVNAIPTNMVDLSEFTPVIDDADGATANLSAGNYGFAGFAPLVVYNPTGASLQLQICTEWRVRLDPFNPMHATGVHHTPTPATLWHQITSAAESAGHGVEEVAGMAAGGYALAQAGGFGGMLETAGMYAARALPTLESLLPLMLL